jgi:predicted metal-binding protein
LKAYVRSGWSNAVLVCAKCSKKLDGGFGPKGKTPLAKALRKHLGLKKGRKGAAGIVEVKCLGVCPRGAVTVVNGAASREWLLVPDGADLDGVAADLGLTS